MTDQLPLPQTVDLKPHTTWAYLCPALPDGCLRFFVADVLVNDEGTIYSHEAAKLIWRLLRKQGVDPTGLRVFPWRAGDDRGEPTR